MEILSKLIPFLLRLFIPQAALGVADIFGAYRTYYLPLPQNTNFEELKQFVLSKLVSTPKWRLLSLDFFKGREVYIPAGEHKLNSQDSFVAFYVERDGAMDTNFARIVKIVCQCSNNMANIIINSHFESAQPIERGKLTLVNDTVMGYIKEYFASKNINITENIAKLEIYKDVATRTDKAINPYFAGVVIFVILFVIALLLFNLERLTAAFLM